MDAKKLTPEQILSELIQRYPQLKSCEKKISEAYEALCACYASGGKVLVAGNGGSASDSEHITGELMKSFRFRHDIPEDRQKALKEQFGEDGEFLAGTLESGLPAIPLPSLQSLGTAFSNDRNGLATFAQLVNVLGNPNDVFIGISTSGNSKNVCYALMVAKTKGMRTIALTGESGGRCMNLSEICINVPEKETFKIQELHLPVYHALCSMVESRFFA